MFALMLIVPLLCWIYTERVARQEEAERVFLEAGGSVQRETNGPEWLRRRLGDELFQSIVEVNLQNAKVDDDCLMWLRRLGSIRKLSVGRRSPGKLSVPIYNRFSEIEYLNLNEMPVTDRGLSYLRGATSIKTLFLNRTDISDAGLEHLAKLKQLRFLWVVETNVTADGVKQLAEALPDAYIGY